jgi:hydrogenase nickel incorporation protein HypA/HybF
MHELSVTESILEIALRHADEKQAIKITSIHLVIGDLASIVDDSVNFYWDIISQGTIAEGAQLIFDRRHARVLCQNCELEYEFAGDDIACPRCASCTFQIISGNEFYLSAIDIEV